MSDNKKKYIEICNSCNIPLFSQHYWMDAVCGEDNWDVILIEENENVLGSLVYFLSPVDDYYEIKKAPLTQNNGIIYFYPEGMKYDRRIAFENKVATKIIDKLEILGINSYRQYFHHGVTNWLPFYWRGFDQSTRYTYIIEDTSNLQKIYANFNGNIRKHIKKAEKIVKIYSGMLANEFYKLNEKTYERQGLGIPYSFDLFEKLYTKLSEHNCIEILYAKDKDGQIHSAALFAYDKDSIYYLMSGSNEDFRDSQALTLLIYEGIKIANKLGKSFDFEGSMKINIERFFRQFGAIQKPYFDIRKKYI